jgi:hypothetical protein
MKGSLMIDTHTLTVTVAGADGAASGTATSTHPLNGRLLAVYIDYIDQPASTDVTIATSHAPVRTLLTVTSANTDAWFDPRAGAVSTAGAALTFDATQIVPVEMAVSDYVTATVAQGNAGSVVVYLMLEQ